MFHLWNEDVYKHNASSYVQDKAKTDSKYEIKAKGAFSVLLTETVK